MRKRLLLLFVVMLLFFAMLGRSNDPTKSGGPL